jgi:hypothetical protein
VQLVHALNFIFTKMIFFNMMMKGTPGRKRNGEHKKQETCQNSCDMLMPLFQLFSNVAFSSIIPVVELKTPVLSLLLLQISDH